MNTKEVLADLARRMGCYKKDVKELLLEHFIELLFETVSRGQKLHLAHFGTFYPGQSPKSPKTGTRRLTVRFKPAEDLLRRLNANRRDDQNA